MRKHSKHSLRDASWSRIVLCLFFILPYQVFAIDFTDPDDYFDNIGRRDVLQTEDRFATPFQRSPSGRENLGDGFLNSNAGSSSEGGRAIATGVGGVTYVAGRTSGANNNFILLKYFADGSFDTSFDTEGMLIHSFGSTDDLAHALVVQTDGAIIVAGRSDQRTSGFFDFAVLRVLSTGGLDTTFNTSGKLTVTFGPSISIARAVTLQTNGKILLAGYSYQSGFDTALLGLNTDGSLDTSFATTGKFTFSNGSNSDAALSVAIDSSGLIIPAGVSYNGTNWDFAAGRVLISGELDTSFNTNGKFTCVINGLDDAAFSVTSDSTNQILLGGKTDNGTNLDFAMVRLLNSGNLDTSFSTSGKRSQAVLANDDAAFSIAVETKGTGILAAGYAYNGSNNDFAVVRFVSSGALDTSFATSGKYTVAIKASEDTAQSLYLNGDGVILVAGRTDVGAGAYDLAFIRLQSDGSLAKSGKAVRSFSGGGKSVSGTDYGYGIITDRQNRLVSVGKVGTDFTIVRLFLDGALDTSFYSTGQKTINVGGTDTAYGVSLQTDDKLVVCGAGNTNHHLARLETDGNVDTAFDTDGQKNLTAGLCTNVLIQTDAKLVMIGDTGVDIYYARMETDGTIDSSFHTDGSNAVTVGANDVTGVGIFDTTTGSIVIRGSYPVGLTNVTTLVRFDLDGTLDTSYSTDGKSNQVVNGGDSNASPGYNQAVVNAEHKIYVASFKYTGIRDQTRENELYISRFNTNGVLDTAFSTDGKNNETAGVVSQPGGVVLTPNEKGIVATTTNADFKFYRFTSDGIFDTSFNTSGSSTVDISGVDTPTTTLLLPNGWVCANGYNGTPDMAIGCIWQ